MPLRDIALTTTILLLLPICLMRPWIGFLVWSWIGYMNPHRLTWSFAYSMPFASMVAGATILGALFVRDPERRPMPWVRETWMLLALWSVYTFTTLMSLYPDLAWPHLSKVSKILLFTFLPLLYFQRRDRLHYLFLVLALSLGFYGLKGGIWVLRSGGNHNVMGPEGTFIGGNTEIGLALNMTLPFLLILAREESRRWLRHLLLAMFVFSIIAIIFTYSRGALLGLPVVLMMLFLRARRRVVGIVGMIALYFFVMNFAPEHWFKRVETIESYQEDRSAVMRLESWEVAWRVALDRPFTGGGFWVMPHEEIWDQYLTGYVRAQSAHSIYFTVLADHGFPGLFLFVGLIVSCFLSLGSLRRKAAGRPETAWLSNYCQMIQASLMGYVVSGAFLTQSYWDLFYHLIMFVILLKVIARNEGVTGAPPPAREVVQRPAVRATSRLARGR